MHSQALLSTMHVQVCTLDRCCEYHVHICFTLATGCAYALCIYMCICICICKKPAKIDYCRGWDPRPCTSVNHRQTGWGIFAVYCAGCSIMLGFSLLDFVKVFVQRVNFFSNAASTIRRRHLDCWRVLLYCLYLTLCLWVIWRA